MTVRIQPVSMAQARHFFSPQEEEALKKKVRKDEENAEFNRKEEFQHRLISSLNSLITR